MQRKVYKLKIYSKKTKALKYALTNICNYIIYVYTK